MGTAAAGPIGGASGAALVGGLLGSASSEAGEAIGYFIYELFE